jgi:GNAT superfamily N-acetyltransferase
MLETVSETARRVMSSPSPSPSPAHDIAISAEPPTSAEHMHLRAVSGLSPRAPAAIAHGLANSVHILTARGPRGVLVGMIRCIGDGALFLQIVDMCVAPAYQRQGVGKRLLDAMLAWTDANAPDAYLCLLAMPAGQTLYRSRGFENTKGVGMKRVK